MSRDEAGDPIFLFFSKESLHWKVRFSCVELVPKLKYLPKHYIALKCCR